MRGVKTSSDSQLHYVLHIGEKFGENSSNGVKVVVRSLLAHMESHYWQEVQALE